MGKAARLGVLTLWIGIAGFAQEPAIANRGQSTPSQTQSGNPEQNTSQNPNPSQPAGQTSNQPPTDQNANSGLRQSGDIPANTEIRAMLDTPLSSKTSKPGDRFTASMSQAVQGRNGVAIPAGARVEGEVSEADQGKTIPALRGKGTLNLRFRDVVLPNGQTIPLVASLVSVNRINSRSTQKADNESEPQGKTVAKNEDEGIGAGTTVGGLVFGAPLKGLAIGALAGGGYVLATNGKEVNLPAQTGMVIRLDQPVSIQ